MSDDLTRMLNGIAILRIGIKGDGIIAVEAGVTEAAAVRVRHGFPEALHT